MCDSDRGDWGKPCPDCGQMLPPRPGPLSSWKATKPLTVKFGTVTDRQWSPEERERRAAANRARQGTAITERQREVVRIVAKHGGNRDAAARELGISGPSVVTTLKRIERNGFRVPTPRPRRRPEGYHWPPEDAA